MVYKVARTLTIDEAAYLAGLIDGEGTITLSRRHAEASRETRSRPVPRANASQRQI